MSDYNDIAKRNPQGAMSVISSFGYEILDRSNLGQSLNELIAQEGEPALRKVMEIHPDKDVILELFSSQSVIPEKKQCECSSCKQRHEDKHDHFMNASGSGVVAENSANSSSSNILAHQTNAILVVASLFIATVLILKNK